MNKKQIAEQIRMLADFKKIIKTQKEHLELYAKVEQLLNKKITLMEKQIKLFKGGE